MNQFNALTGTELLEVIITRIRKKLEDTGEFEYHRTYPLIRLTYSVGVASYPKQDLDSAPLILAKDDAQVPDGSVTSDKSVIADTLIEVEDSIVLDTPDLTRKETGLPISVPVVGTGGITVDKPQAPKIKVINPKGKEKG